MRVQGISSARWTPPSQSQYASATLPHVLQLFTSPDFMGNITPERAPNTAPIEKRTFDQTVPASIQRRPAVRLSFWGFFGDR
eukprot:3697137-Amphidinium_carterae.1